MSNRLKEQVVELDPSSLDSTTIKYLNYDQLSKAELILCIERLLEELFVLEKFIDEPYEVSE